MAACPEVIPSSNFTPLRIVELDMNTIVSDGTDSEPPHPPPSATAETRTERCRKATCHHPYQFGQPTEVSGGGKKFHEWYPGIQKLQEWDQGGSKLNV
jgi:hypothetical protein